MTGKPCGPEFSGLTEAQRIAGHHFVTLWPTMYVVAHVDYVRTVSLKPLGPELTELRAEWLFPRETLEAPGFDLNDVVQFAATVIEQDGAASEMNQRGLRSSAFRARAIDAAGIRCVPLPAMGAEAAGVKEEDMIETRTAPELDSDWDRSGLPAWTYHSPALLELEKQELFRSHWQLACHVSDIPNAGDIVAVDIADDRAVVVRGDDGVVRPFTISAATVVRASWPISAGTARTRSSCPFHGWVYNFDGSLRGAARPQTFGDLDKSRFGLKPIESDVWMGFVFIRFITGVQPSLAETMGLYASELADYRLQDIVPPARQANSSAGELEIGARCRQ